ncbi:MFS transporter [Klebsiella pneumoniae]|nr:MFS transporter [Klebsiella pneumoniae]MDG5868013.1 MFS transporter [Klebsiella pneumoniae]
MVFVTVCYWRFLHLRCFDQQFANFFTSFFATGEQGTRVFGYVTTMGELLNASIMFLRH